MIDIRLMNDADVEQVAKIEKEIFSKPWSAKSFLDSLNSDNTLYVVAQENDVVVGYCGMYMSYGEGNITNVAVSPGFRRQGIAKKTLDYILKLAVENGITDVTLEVRETNVPAIRMYEQLGFEDAGIRKNFYEKPKENALIMWKHNL